MNTLLSLLLSSSAIAQSAPPPSQSCKGPTRSDDILASFDQVEYSFSQADLDGLHAAADALTRDLPCLSDELLRPQAARLHRTLGLIAWVKQDKATARVEFAAARSIQPRYTFPDSILPDGHPILSDYSSLSVASIATTPIGAPKSGRLQLDGRLSVQRPSTLPSLVQLFNAEGAVSYTANLQANQPLPPYEAYAPGKLPSSYSGQAQLRADQLLGLGAASVGVASLSFLGAALVQRGRWYSNDTPYNQLDLHRKQANTYSKVGSTLGALGLGLGFGAAFTHTW